MNRPREIFLKDYQVLAYNIREAFLDFDLDDSCTIVKSTLSIERNTSSYEKQSMLTLVGEKLKLKDISLDGVKLSEVDYQVSDSELLIKKVPEKFVLQLTCEINPSENKTLEGLYKSGNIFCTQNEPEGFRRITYFLDRPDNMCKFKTKITATKKKYPTLLSNGNLIGQGDLESGKHWVLWEDPFPKPSYLFALVAGNLGMIQNSFKTMSGRNIVLKIFCDKGNEERCTFAMDSLIKAFAWDEERFGLEYDLDNFMIVAVDSFNFGAMENKGLNIFNSSLVLANPQTATDEDYGRIEGVIGHEYFHNFTGNRITCRDWFQLTLKEGLTVFRDQEFSGDMNSKTIQRIQDVQSLRERQFPEDDGPMSHPIKPKSYIEINNFYTSTIYEKGSEVIRMIYTLLGKDGFRRGIDKYFELFDGMAVTTEDFLHAMSIANNSYDFTQFKRWYDQAGRPKVKVTTLHENNSFSVRIEQDLENNSDDQKPFFFPLKFGLLAEKGEEISLDSVEDNPEQVQLKSGILHIKNKKEKIIFTNMDNRPVLSINRDFSAPVDVQTDYSFSDNLFLMENDTDLFNRYQVTQTIMKEILVQIIADLQESKAPKIPTDFVEVFGNILKQDISDKYLKGLLIEIPTENELHQNQKSIDYVNTHKASYSSVILLACANCL